MTASASTAYTASASTVALMHIRRERRENLPPALVGSIVSANIDRADNPWTPVETMNQLFRRDNLLKRVIRKRIYSRGA